jgi:hypothetical protein
MFLTSPLIDQALSLIDLVEQPRDIGALRSDPNVVRPHPNTKFSFSQGGSSHDRTQCYFAGNDSLDWDACRTWAGIGMLISRGLSKDAMKAAGLALTVVGGFTTIPLAISIMGKKHLSRPEIRSVA